MADRSRNVPSGIDDKWTRMRLKHEEETSNFLRNVAKNRAEFEDRVLAAKKQLLAKHQEAERVFWSENDGSRATMTPAPVARNGQVQTSRKTHGTTSSAKGTPAPSKKSTPAKAPAPVKKSAPAKTAPPVKKSVPTWNPGPAPALPRMELSTNRKTPSQTPAQETARPAKPFSRKIQKDCDNDIIVLSSDDEDTPTVVKSRPVAPRKTPAVPRPVNMNTAPRPKPPVAPTMTPTASKPVFTQPLQQPETIDESMEDESESPELTDNNFASTLPEATLEFFGGFARAPMASTTPFQPVRSFVKEESVQPRSPSVSSRAPLPSTPPRKTFHGLPEQTSSSPFAARPFPSPRPSGSAGGFASFTPPATPGFVSWNGGFSAPSSGFSPQAKGSEQGSQQQSAFGGEPPFANNMQFGSGNPESSSPFSTFSGRAPNVAPESKNRSSSNFGIAPSPAPPSQEPVKSWASLATEHGPPRTQTQKRSPFMAMSEDIEQQPLDTPMDNDVATYDTVSIEPASTKSSSAANPGPVNTEEQAGSAPAKYVCMLDTAQVSSNITTSSPQKSSTPIQHQGYLDARPSIEDPQTTPRQLLSAPQSHASVVSEQVKPSQHRASAPGSAFKLPTAPASASVQPRPSLVPEGRGVRAGTVDSRASSFTLPAQSRSHRGVSIASRTSRDSARTGASQTRKRPIEYSLSDDDEDVSDYAPSEPESPLANKPAKESRDGSVIKKSKIMNGASQATQFDKNRAKNGFGFKKSVVTHKPKPATSPFSSTTPVRKPSTGPSTTTKKPFTAGVTVVRKGATLARAKPTTTTSKSTPKKNKVVPQPSRRRAAMTAENRIANIYEENEEFETECAIEDADQFEDARLPDTLRRMSLTPMEGDESVEMLMERDESPALTAAPTDMTTATTAPTTATTAKPTDNGNYDFSAWTRDRETGDRHMAKKNGGRYQATVRDEDDEEEADIRGRAEEVEELDLTGDE